MGGWVDWFFVPCKHRPAQVIVSRTSMLKCSYVLRRQQKRPVVEDSKCDNQRSLSPVFPLARPGPPLPAAALPPSERIVR